MKRIDPHDGDDARGRVRLAADHRAPSPPPSRATATSSCRSRRRADFPRALMTPQRRRRLQHRRGDQRPRTARRRCRPSASCSASRTRAATRRRSPSASTRGSPSGSSLGAASTRADTASCHPHRARRSSRRSATRSSSSRTPRARARASPAKSVVDDEAGVRAAARELVERYGQPALVEEYIVGREFTVGLLGERRPQCAAADGGGVPRRRASAPSTTTRASRLHAARALRVPGEAHAGRAPRDREARAATTFTTLGCRDVARIDLRMTRRRQGRTSSR